MSFVEPSYIAFYVLVFAVYWRLGRVWQNRFLTAVSCLFYGWIDPWLIALLLFSAMLDYVCALRISARRDHGNRWLALAVLGNIGTLCTFKYFDFFLLSIADALESVGVGANVSTLGLLLPVGLSFYTFQTLSYTIDVYREQLEVRRNLGDYLVFVCFFPQLVAGPVERAGNVLPQFEAERVFDVQLVRSGLALALWGGFKKIVIADTLAPYVDLVFATDDPSFAMVWAGALGFTVQVLADFSGYTDIAIGSARMLGIRLMENFDHPYLAATPMEFWRRWHISFSTWLRDYLYLPLSFSPWVRRYLTVPGTEPWGYLAHTSRALLITMLASGLWHGSTANFILWGLYYWLIGSVYAWAVKKIPKKTRRSRNWRPVTVPLMFCFTLLGMLIFREPDVARLLQHLQQSPLAGTEAQWIAATVLFVMTLLCALPLVLSLAAETWLEPRLRKTQWMLPVQTTLWASYVVGMFIFVRTSAADFVYFQF